MLIAVITLNIFVWILTGFVIARYGLKIQEVLLLLPVSLGIGITLNAWLLNILLRPLSTPAAAWSSLFLMLLVSGFLWYRYRHAVAPLQLSCQKKTALGLLIIWIIFAVLIAKARPAERVDERDHAPRATMIAIESLPMRLATQRFDNSAACYNYHYADSAMTGVMFREAGYQGLNTLQDVRVIYNMVAILGLCFAFVWSLFKRTHIAWSVVGAVLFVTAGYANWIALIHHSAFLDKLLPQGKFLEPSRALAPSIISPFADIKPYLIFPNVAWLGVSLTSYMNSPNPPAFWTVALLVLIAWLHLDKKPRQWVHYVILGIMTGFTALFFTTGMPLIAGVIGLDLALRVWEQRRAPRTALTNLVLFGAVTLLTVILQGGVVTDFLFCPRYNIIPTPRTEYIIGFESKLFFAYFDGTTVSLLKPYEWLNVILDWGIGLFFYPIMVVYLLRKKQRYPSLLMIVGFGFFMLPFITQYQNAGNNNARFTVFSTWLLGALSPFLLADLWKRRWYYLNYGLVIFLILLMSVTGTVNLLWQATRLPQTSLIMDDIDYTVQKDEFRHFDPNTVIFDPMLQDPTRATPLNIQARLTMTFGVYGQPLVTPQEYANATDKRSLWLQMGLPGDLLDSGADYLYFDERALGSMVWMHLDKLLNPQYYKLIRLWTDKQNHEMRWLYQPVSDVRASDQPPTVLPDSLPMSGEQAEAYSIHANRLISDPSAIILDPAQGNDALRYNRLALLSWHIDLTMPPATIQADIFDLMKTLEQQRYQAELELAVRAEADLNQWRENKDPTYLKSAGVEYLLVDNVWWSYLSEAEYATLTDPTQYELIKVWEFAAPLNQTYRLIKIVSSPDD